MKKSKKQNKKLVYSAGTSRSIWTRQRPNQYGGEVSKKEYKRAVDRNLFKRLARETFRKNQDNLDHLDFVVMAKKSKSKNNSELTLDLITLMKNAKTKAKTQWNICFYLLLRFING